MLQVIMTWSFFSESGIFELNFVERDDATSSVLVESKISVRILYRKHVGLGCRYRWGRSPLGLGRRNPSRRLLPPPSRRPNPNGLPQPIRVRVRGGAAP
jgi:hypothetical protein